MNKIIPQLFSITLFAFLLINPELSHAQLVQIGQDVDGVSAGENSGYRVALNDDATIMVTTAPFSSMNGLGAGDVKIFELVDNNWEQLGSTIIGEAEMDNCGVDMELNQDGTIIAIGAPSNEGDGFDAGHVRVFQFNGTDWEQMGADLNGINNEAFGISIALSDDGLIMAVAATESDIDGTVSTGTVRTYEFDGTDWLQFGSDLNGTLSYDRFGTALAISADGTIMAISKRLINGEMDDPGEVIVYEYNGTDWVQLGQRLQGQEIINAGVFGYDLDLNASGDIIAISDIYDNLNNTLWDAGKVKIFKLIDSNWISFGQLTGEEGSQRFGTKVKLNDEGDRLAVAAHYFNPSGTQSGQVRIFDFENSAWVRKYPNIDGEAENDFSGWAIDLDETGSHIAIGAIGNDDGGGSSGHVRV